MMGKLCAHRRAQINEFFTSCNTFGAIVLGRIAGIVMILWTVVFVFFVSTEKHFILMAQSLLRGTLAIDISQANRLVDFVPYHGLYFITWGPLPAILLLPFVLVLGIGIKQTYLGFFINIFNVFLLMRLAKRLGYEERNQQLLVATAFFLGSVYIGVSTVLFSSWLGETIVVSCLLLALNEFFARKRYWLIGLFLAFGFLTRITVGPTVVFFLLHLFQERSIISRRAMTHALGALLLPMMLAGVVYAGYNYMRFENIWEVGQRYVLLPEKLAEIRATTGIVSVKNIPRHLSALFLKIPSLYHRPFISPEGLNVFIVSPYLISLVGVSRKNYVAMNGIVASILAFIPMSLFFSTGDLQFGYRFMLDFFPFLFVAFLVHHQGKFSLKMRYFIALSALTNVVLCMVFLFGLSLTTVHVILK